MNPAQFRSESSCCWEGGGVNTQPSGVSHIIQSQFVLNVSGNLGVRYPTLAPPRSTDLGTVQQGLGGGGIATGNTYVTVLKSTITDNTPDNCSPLNTVPGCVG